MPPSSATLCLRSYDTNKDRRISMSEFKRLAKVNHILANWGMQIK
jgi:hypothetical protein